MTAAQTEAEWIDWAGGECPVPGETLVEVRFRDGDEWLVVDGMEGPAGDFCPTGGPSTPNNDNWLHNGSDCDIVKYRVVVSQ